jgi:murein DD-endopeptidase MepM/ murein hydrolase activator NlpD
VPERILIYLDQGEELYTRAARAASKDSARFSALLADGMSDPRLVAFGSMRADYFDRLQADADLFAVYEHVNVPPLTRDQLEDVVTGPPKLLKVGFADDKLPKRIVNAAAGTPGALPLLSYLLTDMWSAMLERRDNVLRLPVDVIDIGGVLARRADEFLEKNPHAEPSLKRLLTLRLALVPAEGEPVRRPARRVECSGEEWGLAEQLADDRWRLVVISRRESDGEVHAEVAHEALLRAWPRLEGWLRDERDFLVFKSDVERAQRLWQEMMRDDRALLTGLDLNRTAEWLPKRGDDLSSEVRQFISASTERDRAAKARALRNQRRVTAGAVVTALILAVVGGVAVLKWGDAEVQRQRAEEQTQRANDANKLLALMLGGAKAPSVEAVPSASAPPPPNGAPAFQWPVRGRVIKNYGVRVNGATNDGIDLAVPEGTPVRSADDGVVAYAGNELKGYGNLVLVRHANGFVTAYANGSELLVKRNDQVQKGQLILKSGRTGEAAIPQLHFEIRKNSLPLDPMKYLPTDAPSSPL